MVVINNKNYNNINPIMGITSVTNMGGIGPSIAPNNIIPDKVFKKNYTQLTNTFHVGCPEGWTHTVDNVPSASSDIEINNLNLYSTGLPICKKGTEHCYPSQIGLMGEDMFEKRISKCSDDNQVKYHKPSSIINNIQKAKDICNKENKCQGFIMSKNPKEGALFITEGLDKNSVHKVWGNMKKSRVGGGGMYTTHMKNAAPQGYVNLPIDMMNQVNKPIDTEHFVGDDRIQSVVRNSALLILVLVLSTVVVRRLA